MTIKTIIFDLGGVVIGTMTREFLSHASEKLNIPEPELERLIAKFEPDLHKGVYDHLTFWERLLAHAGKTAPRATIQTLWSEPYQKHVRRKEDTIELITELKKKYRVGCISNTQEPHVSIMADMGVLALFNPCVLSNEVGMRKPELPIFQHYLRITECKPEEAVFIDDNAANVASANELGMHGILFTTADELRSALEKLAVHF